MDQKNQTKKLPGFYIALCCCVIAIGAAGFFIQNTDDSQSANTLTAVTETDSPDYGTPLMTEAAETAEQELPVVSSPQPVSTEEYTGSSDSPAVADASSGTDTVPAAEDTENYAYDNPDLEPASVIVQAEESGSFTDPVPGMTVLYGFSGDTLMYNEVLGDWRTHDGIDIAADTGCSVSAASGGTVSSVGTGTYGKTVTIDHGDSLVTVYAQLSEVNVSQGDTVSTGDVIGTIGESTGENTREPHLHFEVLRDGKPEDPEEF